MSKLLEVSKEVKILLIVDPAVRDSDHLLILKIWALQEPRLRNRLFSFKRFAIGFKDGEYINPATIIRARAKLQEEIPTLRGKLYKIRMKQQEKVKEELKDGSMIAGGTP